MPSFKTTVVRKRTGVYNPYRNSKRSRYGPPLYQPRSILNAGRTRTTGYYGRYTGRSQELKFFDKTHIIDLTDLGGTVKNDIMEISAGTGENQRIGRKLTLRHLNMRYTIKNEGSTMNTVRVIVILDKQCNGTGITVPDFLQTEDYQSFNNLANSNRFKTLHDRMHTVPSQGVSTAIGKLSDELYIKDLNVPVEYSGTTGGLTEIKSANISMLVIPDKASTNLSLRFNSTTRLRYSDS